jgi:hypothetical protein
MADYPLSITGAEIDSALGKVHSADTTPTNGSTDMVTSGGVYTAINNLSLANLAGSALVTESEGIAGNDNDTTIPTSAAVKDYVDTSTPTVSVASFTKASGSKGSTGLITGYSESDADGIASESSGTITITGAGTYLVNFGGVFSEGGSGSFDVQYRVNGGSVMNRTDGIGTQETISYSVPKVISSGSFTVDIRCVEAGVSTLTFSNVRVDIIKLS